MEASRKRRGTGPRAAGAIASAFAFGLGVVSLFYFVEFRGSGIRVELASVHGPELMIVSGGILLLAVAAYFAVSAVARRAADDSDIQELLQLAHQLDVTDPEALRAFDAVPPLRDVVAQLVTEKAHARELSDRLETVRGEITGLAEGMRRSAQDLGHLREESLGAAAMQVALLWNGLVDRLQEAEAARNESVAGSTGPADAAHPDIGALVARLDELESELARLRDAVATPSAVADPSPGTGLWNVRESQSEPPLEIEPTSKSWGAKEAVVQEEPFTGWAAPEPRKAPDEAPTISARELFLDDETFGPEEGFAQVAPEPQTSRPEARAAQGPFAPRSLLPDELGIPRVQPAPPVHPRAEVRGAATPSRPPVEPRPRVSPEPAGFAPEPPEAEVEGMRFPDFAGGPKQRPADRVELTYENQTGEDVADLPASALLFDPEEEAPSADGVFDLRSFGATEYDK